MKDNVIFRYRRRSSIVFLTAFAVFVAVLLTHPQMFADSLWIFLAMGVTLVAVLTDRA